MIPTEGAVPLLIPLNEPMLFPVPLNPRPIVPFELAQVYSVPLKFDEKLRAEVGVPAHIVSSLKGFITGVGSTTMLKVSETPVHVLPANVKLGVTIISAVIGALVVLVALKEREPEPKAPRPMAGLSLVQLYIVPATFGVDVNCTEAGSCAQTC